MLIGLFVSTPSNTFKAATSSTLPDNCVLFIKKEEPGGNVVNELPDMAPTKLTYSVPTDSRLVSLRYPNESDITVPANPGLKDDENLKSSTKDPEGILIILLSTPTTSGTVYVTAEFL